MKRMRLMKMFELNFISIFMYSCYTWESLAVQFRSFTHVEQLDGKQCNVSDIVSVEYQTSAVKCGISCQHHALCNGFTYDADTQTCTGCRVPYGPQSTLVPGQLNNIYYTGEWLTFGGHAYKLSTTMMPFDNASDYCGSFGAYFARIESEAESAFIRQQDWWYTPIWIGLTDKGHEGVWTWVYGGDETNFTDWNLNPPNIQPTGYDNHHCANLQRRFSFQWADRPCRSEYNVLCEK